MAEQHVTSRWLPHRAGIRNIWEYDDQIFAFAGGRLILRGPNGSGKSNALALLFPFLLDGTMSAAAMDPFAGGRSMKSLLLGVVRDDTDGRRFRHDQRLGYVWLEFERPSPEPGPNGAAVEYRTIGCGARATAHGDTRSWFFVTDRRAGIDLDLAPDGTPLTRGKLAEEVGTSSVFDTAEDYRSAVDRELFQLGPDRLAKLTSLIRVLRRPQLAGKLNLDLLSEVLSSGLPAIDPNALDDVASSLDDLERVQGELSDLRATLDTVERFLPTYRSYLREEALLRVHAVTDADKSLAAARRALGAAEAETARLEAATREVDEQRAAVALAVTATDARRSAHLESPAYQSASSLREIDEAARIASLAAADAEHRLTQATQRHDAAQTRFAASANRSQELLNTAVRTAQATLDLVDALDASWTLTPDEQLDPDRLGAAAKIVERERRNDIAQVRAALRSRDEASRDHTKAEEDASVALQALDLAEAKVSSAEEAATEQRRALTESVRRWTDNAPGLDDLGVLAMVDAVASIGDPGQPGLAERYRELTQVGRDSLVARRTLAADSLTAMKAESTEISDERGRVAAEVDPGPVPASWRRSNRDGRTGAPLWACCDFIESGLNNQEQANVEAALDAAGLLDAWISTAESADMPTGALGQDDPDTFDAWLRPEQSTPPPSAGAVSTVLRASAPEGSGLTTDDVQRVLGAVSLGDVGIAVSPTGRFTLGPLQGRSTKTAPEFIGATARAERRRRRLDELDAQLKELSERITGQGQEIQELDDDVKALQFAAESIPSTDELNSAITALAQAKIGAELRLERSDQAREQEARQAALLAAATDQLTSTAGERRIAPTAEALDGVEATLGRFVSAAHNAVAARRDFLGAEEKAAQDQALAAQAANDADEAGRAWTAANAAATAADARAATLRAEVGSDAADAVRNLERLDDELRQLNVRREELIDTIRTIDQQMGIAISQVAEAEGRITSEATRLNRTCERLPVLRRADLLTLLISGPGEPEGNATAVAEFPVEPVTFARRLAELIDGRPPTADAHRTSVASLDRAQKALLDDLHRGYDPSITHDDDLVAVEVTSDAGTFGLSVLAQKLRQQELTLATYLTAGDQEVFERFLLNKVSHELRRLLAGADEFVYGVNGALEHTSTASGLRVELAWTLGTDDQGIREAVRLLRHDTNQMGEEDRSALRRFFDRTIRQQRADDPEAGYRVALERALDYRQWHEFQPYLRTPDGGRAKLTRSKFRELSGGEQAVTLHLPLFAAAAAHYARADSSAPRLIALDEAFAGIDESMRGELMALTVLFDLDVILTGHELWGAYAEVPSIAVHDLLRRPPAEGVSVLSLHWNGHSLDADSAIDFTTNPEPITDGLFAAEPDTFDRAPET